MIRLGSVLKTSLQDVLKISQKSLEGVLKMSWRFFYKKTTSSFGRRLEDILERRLEDVLKTYDQDEYIRLDQGVLKTSSEDEDERRLQDVFVKTNVCWDISGINFNLFLPSIILNSPLLFWHSPLLLNSWLIFEPRILYLSVLSINYKHFSGRKILESHLCLISFSVANFFVWKKRKDFL